MAGGWRRRRDDSVFYAEALTLCAVVLWCQLRCLGAVDSWLAAWLAR